ncbi:MAG: T9SS type A sorting domain-containing protein [candidate division KSB1 bacterium]|nr:T9SS type A sorting domain-containing protein [candidate division KSB1 bacterium]
MRRVIFPRLFGGFLLALFASAATAADLRVLWLPNAETDLAGYVVYYGTQPGLYTHRIEVGRQTAYTIKDLEENRTYFIAVAAVDTAGNESPFSDEVVGKVGGRSPSKDSSGRLPRQHQLLQNHPNPFHVPSEQTTTIAFELYETAPVKLEIFDLLGHPVATLVDKELSAGQHKFSWNARNDQDRAVRAGVYIYRLQTDRQKTMRKLVVYR